MRGTRDNSGHCKIKPSETKVFRVIVGSLVRKRSRVRFPSWAPIFQTLRLILSKIITANVGKCSLAARKALGTNSGHGDAIDSLGLIRNFQALGHRNGQSTSSLSQTSEQKTTDVGGRHIEGYGDGKEIY